MLDPSRAPARRSKLPLSGFVSPRRPPRRAPPASCLQSALPPCPAVNSKVSLYHGAVMDVGTDACVNAANQGCMGGGGVDGAIHDQAGDLLRRECATFNGCKCGQTRITKAYNLPAKFVLHTVGPIGEDEVWCAMCRGAGEVGFSISGGGGGGRSATVKSLTALAQALNVPPFTDSYLSTTLPPTLFHEDGSLRRRVQDIARAVTSQAAIRVVDKGRVNSGASAEPGLGMNYNHL